MYNLPDLPAGVAGGENKAEEEVFEDSSTCESDGSCPLRPSATPSDSPSVTPSCSRRSVSPARTPDSSPKVTPENSPASMSSSQNDIQQEYYTCVASIKEQLNRRRQAYIEKHGMPPPTLARHSKMPQTDSELDRFLNYVWSRTSKYPVEVEELQSFYTRKLRELTSEFVLRPRETLEAVPRTDSGQMSLDNYSKVKEAMKYFDRLQFELKSLVAATIIDIIPHHLHSIPFRRRRHSKSTLKCLSKWFLQHKGSPYPTIKQKVSLAEKCGITVRQVSNWFSYQRQARNITKRKSRRRSRRTKSNSKSNRMRKSKSRSKCRSRSRGRSRSTGVGRRRRRLKRGELSKRVQKIVFGEDTKQKAAKRRERRKQQELKRKEKRKEQEMKKRAKAKGVQLSKLRRKKKIRMSSLDIM